METKVQYSGKLLRHPTAASPPCHCFRVALGYNRLATLPTAFALLSRLRYLNLQNNSFSVFPDVVSSHEVDALNVAKIVAVDGHAFSRDSGH
jgi:hypothetical protein